MVCSETLLIRFTTSLFFIIRLFSSPSTVWGTSIGGLVRTSMQLEPFYSTSNIGPKNLQLYTKHFNYWLMSDSEIFCCLKLESKSSDFYPKFLMTKAYHFFDLSRGGGFLGMRKSALMGAYHKELKNKRYRHNTKSYNKQEVNGQHEIDISSSFLQYLNND